jgi:nucleotide-binding universal stress UspA family protein
MFQTMLVPLDFSESSLKLLRLASALGTPGATTLHLFHATEEENDFAIHSSNDLIAFFEEIEVKRDRWLRELAIEMEADGFEVVIAIRKGTASDEILSYAKEIKADVILISTVGIDLIKRVLLGSTSKRVLRESEFPVLSINACYAESEAIQGNVFPTNICVTTDFSPESDAGIELAVALANDQDATLHLLHVLKLPSMIPVLPGEPPLMLPPHVVDAVWEHSQAQLKSAAESLGDERVEYELVMGADHAEVVADYVTKHNMDLVVMPRVGQNVLQSLLFGRTAAAVVKLCPVPVLTLPRKNPS